MRKVGWGGECLSPVSQGAVGDVSAAHKQQLNSAVWLQSAGPAAVLGPAASPLP